MFKELGDWRSALVVYCSILGTLGVMQASSALSGSAVSGAKGSGKSCSSGSVSSAAMLPLRNTVSGEEKRDKHVVTALVYRATVLHAMGRYVFERDV